MQSLSMWPNFSLANESDLRDLFILENDSLQHSLHFVDLHCLSYFSNKDLNRALKESIVIPDGKFVYLITRLLGVRSSHIRGIDFFENSIRFSNLEKSHFFLGGTSDVLNEIKRRAIEINPKLVIAGTFSPPFTENIDELVELAQPILENTHADIVWVGLGAPKQILFASKIEGLISGNCVTVGAAFDFFAGSKKSAPKLISQFGLEWMYRIFMEPRRLVFRYSKILIVSPMILIRLTFARLVNAYSCLKKGKTFD